MKILLPAPVLPWFAANVDHGKPGQNGRVFKIVRALLGAATMLLPAHDLPDLPPDRDELCAVYDLGTPLGPWRPVGGERTHALWALTTDRGRYAVKVFDQTVDHTRYPDWKDVFVEAAALETAAWRAGLPVPRPIPIAGAADTALLADVPAGPNTVTVRLHEWVTGHALTDARPDPEPAAAAGAFLARVHHLPITCAHTEAYGMTTPPDPAELADLAARAHRRHAPWAAHADTALATLRTVADLARARDHVAWPPIPAHRDLSPKNALRSATGLVVVDWDTAGPWTAAEEAASAAFEWAGAMSGPPRRDVVRAFAAGYRDAGGDFPAGRPEAGAGWLVKNAWWTAMHIRHALDPTLSDRRRKQAADAVPALVRTLTRLAEGVPVWATWASP
jgi:hypothetical protein